jgi:hypothetical protein
MCTFCLRGDFSRLGAASGEFGRRGVDRTRTAVAARAFDADPGKSRVAPMPAECARWKRASSWRSAHPKAVAAAG